MLSCGSRSAKFGPIAERNRHWLANRPAGHFCSENRELPAHIGALPPGPAPPEGDWFTRLLERWKEIQQRIEKLQAEDAAGGRTGSSDSAKAAASASKSTPQSKKELAAPIGTADRDGVQ